MKIERARRLDAARGSVGPAKIISIRYCSSCPALSTRTRTAPPRYHSPPRARPLSHTLCPYSRLSLPPCRNMLSHRTLGSAVNGITKRSYTCKCGCPCPLPCGPFGCGCGCGCLPPPCNQPPKCIQFMTGYYYYPYGWWFCGPYHVSGTCCPVAGSCACPCGPCPAKCCPPCCVCPAVGGVVSDAGLKDLAKGGIFHKLPNPPRQEPVKVNNKSGISKFFPFSATTALSASGGPVPKTDRPKPILSSTATSLRRYSTDDSYKDHLSHNFPQRQASAHGFNQTLPQSQCPPLQQPRVLPSRAERDMPLVRPGAFSYSSIPNFKSPYPQPLPELKSYES